MTKTWHSAGSTTHGVNASFSHIIYVSIIFDNLNYDTPKHISLAGRKSLAMDNSNKQKTERIVRTQMTTGTAGLIFLISSMECTDQCRECMDD